MSEPLGTVVRMNGLVIDCGCCVMRGRGCRDCVVSALLGADEAHPTVLAPDERRVLGLFAEAGLLPPLRLVRGVGEPEPERWAVGV